MLVQLNYLPVFLVTDGEDENGLQHEKIGRFFKSFSCVL